MQLDILSLFPAIATAALGESIMKRAQEKGLASFRSLDLRDWTHDRHRTADDTPYGGGAGMVMKCEPIFEAIESIKTPETRVVYMSPSGRRFTQHIAGEYAQRGGHVVLLSGHYEGVDQRVLDHLVDDELSIGDYVLTNGVIAAVVAPGTAETAMLTEFLDDYQMKLPTITAAESVSKMIGIIDGLDQAKAVKGINNYDGNIMPW